MTHAARALALLAAVCAMLPLLVAGDEHAEIGQPGWVEQRGGDTRGCRDVDVVALAFFNKEAALSACLHKLGRPELTDTIAELHTGDDSPRQRVTPLMAAAAAVRALGLDG